MTPETQLTPDQRVAQSCSCDVCKAMCKQSPCLPTPEDAIKLKRAGFGKALASTAYVDLPTLQVYTVIAPIETKNGCIFQDNRGLCMLHHLNLKPTEGRLAIHNQSDNGLRVYVAKTWQTDEGQRVLKIFG